MGFLTGRRGRYEQRSTLNPGQQTLHQQYLNSLNGPGAGGAFGDVADYYRGNLSDNPRDFDAFAAPELRRFREETIPGLSEQFAGMGSGGLSSSGFRNAAVSAGTDLSERLGSIRAQLRQQAAQGLSGLAQGGLNPVTENIYQQGQPGAIDYLGQGLGVAGGAFFGPAGAAAGNMAGNWLSNSFGSNKQQDTSQIYGGGGNGPGGGGRR